MCDASHSPAGTAPRHDADPAETAEWRDGLQSLVEASGAERAGYVLDNLLGHAAALGLRANSQTRTAYLNTIPADQEPPFPGNLAVEERIARINRWNALAMVVRANQAHGELGGHIASYASAADLFEVGFTIPSALARDARVETHGTGDGLRVEMTFLGTEDARRRITDVIAELPSTCRTFRRYYAQGSGGDE